MKIKITAQTPDLREGIEKILPEGRVFRCTPELAKRYLDAEVAELVDAPKQVKKERKTKKINKDG